MSGFRDINRPFLQTDLAGVVFYMPILMMAISYVVFPYVRSQWTWDQHGMGTIVAIIASVCVVVVGIKNLDAPTKNKKSQSPSGD